MDNLDKNIQGSLEENTVIPETVEQKCQGAYKFIRENEVEPQKKKGHLAAKICLPIAASFAILFGIGFANPAFAAQVPIMKNVFQLFKSEPALNYKAAYVNGDQDKYAKSVNQTANSKAGATSGVAITVQQVSCDSTNLYVTYSLKSSNPELVGCTSIFANKGVDSANGQQIYSDPLLNFQRNKDGTYVAMQHFDLSAQDLPDKFNLSINIDDMDGQMPVVDKYGETCKSITIKGTWNFDLKVTKDHSHDKVYTVNKTNNGVKLNKVTLTPGATDLELVIPDTLKDMSLNFKIRDNNGKLIGCICGQNTKIDGATLSRVKCEVVPKNAKTLTISVVDKNGKLGTFAKFTLQLTK